MSKCAACETNKAKHEDPANPILEYGICLCDDCWCEHAQDVISEAKDTIDYIKAYANDKGLELYE